MDVPVQELDSRIDSHYQLVIVAARRTKQLSEGAPKLIDIECSKPTTVALWEIAKGKIKYSEREGKTEE